MPRVRKQPVTISGQESNSSSQVSDEELAAMELDPDAYERAVNLDKITPESLDRFLAETFQTTTLEKNGMPSLEWLKSKFQSKSAAIRYLHYKGFKVVQIHKHLGVRYQQVRNVLSNQLKRGPNENFKIDEEAEDKTESSGE